MIDYTRYIVEVLSSAQEGSSGSGVLYYPDDSESAVIITAKHVLENSEVKDLDICSIRMSSGKTQGISLNDYLDDSQIHRSDTDDLALILVPLSIIKGITGDLTQLPSVDRRFDFEFCQSLGYPHANDGTIKLLNSQFRAFNAKDKHLIEATTAHHEDLVTKYADAIDNVKGMSGGAFFYSDGTKYLQG